MTKIPVKAVRVFGVAALASTIAVGISIKAAYSADMPAPGASPAQETFDTVAYWGIDFDRRNSSQYGYGVSAGMVHALSGNIAVSGWTVTANAGLSRSATTASRTDGVYGSALLGYQWRLPSLYFTLGAGVNYVHNDIRPAGSPGDGDAVGAIFQYGFQLENQSPFSLQSYGAYSTANRQTYAHAKLGYNVSIFRVGPEITYSDTRTSGERLRFGAFIGEIPIGDRVKMILSAGYQQNRQRGARDGGYATIGFYTPLKLR